jgi:hypothetical protein
MNGQSLGRVGAIAAVTAAIGHVVATVLEPDWSGAPDAAMTTLAGSSVWNADRLVDLISLILTVLALAILGRTFTGRSRAWAGAAQPILGAFGAIGAGAILSGATLKTLADAWIAATPEAKQSYLPAFTAVSEVTSNLFFGAFLVIGVYLLLLATAINSGSSYPRWVGLMAALSGSILIVGDLVMLVNDLGFVIVLLGFALFNVLLATLGIMMWRHGTQEQTARTDRRETAHSL